MSETPNSCASPKSCASIDERILLAFDQLTASQRRLASVVMELKGSLSSFAANEIAERAGTSQATAVRFFRRLGYESYADLRREARQSAGWASPLYQISGSGHVRGASGDFALHIAQDLKNLTQTADSIPKESLDAAVSMLAGARRILIIGYRNSAVLGAYARNLLSLLHDDVVLLPCAGMSVAETLLGLHAGDVLLAIGFRRRPVALNAVLRAAREASAGVLLVTDPTAIGSAKLADLTLRCTIRSAGPFDSYAAGMSLINYLCSRITDEGGEAIVERLRRFEDLHEQVEGAGPLAWSAD